MFLRLILLLITVMMVKLWGHSHQERWAVYGSLPDGWYSKWAGRTMPESRVFPNTSFHHSREDLGDNVHLGVGRVNECIPHMVTWLTNLNGDEKVAVSPIA